VNACVFSADRRYRYDLWRSVGDSPNSIAFIGLNPSTADEMRNDPTVSRCINRARLWGFGVFHMLNIFGFRATNPRDMKAVDDPVGSENDEWLLRVAGDADFVVAAWGTHGAYRDRGEEVRRLLGAVELHHLGLTKKGYPHHPLGLRTDSRPERWAEP
jgi:hypothetical protein